MKRRITFNEIIELSKKANLPFSLESVAENSVKFTNHHHPWSIRETEADIIYNIITSNNLKVGFEICTGVGISGLTAAYAFSNTGGKLVSIDAYVEETFNLCSAYDINTKIVKKAEDSDGYRMTSYLSSKLGISNHLVLDVGWSPDDVPTSYVKHHGNNKLDYAFIDGGHTQKQIDEDVKVLLSFLSENAVIVFHDSDSNGSNTIDLIKNYYGFVNYRDYKTEFNLSAYSRGNISL